MDWRLPFTVRVTTPGLPRRMLTASCSVHVIEVSAWMTPMYICDPSLTLVSMTKQGSGPTAMLITRSETAGVADTVGEGVGVGLGRAAGWLEVIPEAAGCLTLPGTRSDKRCTR